MREIRKSKKKNRIRSSFVGIVAILLLCVSGAGVWLLHLRPTKQHAENVIRSEFSEIMAVDSSTNPVVAALANGLDITIESVSLGYNEYTVKCLISNYDIAAAYTEMTAGELANEEMTLNDFLQRFVVCLTSQPRLEYEEEFVIQRDGKTYTTQFTQEQYDHCTGNLLTYIGENYVVQE